jgi:hypothetical protein
MKKNLLTLLNENTINPNEAGPTKEGLKSLASITTSTMHGDVDQALLQTPK